MPTPTPTPDSDPPSAAEAEGPTAAERRAQQQRIREAAERRQRAAERAQQRRIREAEERRIAAQERAVRLAVLRESARVRNLAATPPAGAGPAAVAPQVGGEADGAVGLTRTIAVALAGLGLMSALLAALPSLPIRHPQLQRRSALLLGRRTELLTLALGCVALVALIQVL